MSNGRSFVVYTVIRRGDGNDKEKDFWQRIGIAFINRDGSMNVILNALPTNGRLHIREPAPQEEQASTN